MDKNGAAQKLIAIFGHMDFIGLLHSILVETSKYIIIILFAIYTWHCFSVFVGNNTEKKDKVYRRQNKIMYTIHFICTAVLFLNSLDVTILGLYLAQLALLIFVNKAYIYVYENASKMVLNNMLMLLMIGFVMIGRLNRDHLIRQMIFAAAICLIGLFIPLLIERFSYFDRFGLVYAVIGILMLALVFVIGKTIYGAKNWIVIGGFAMQPSEFVKIIYVFFVAALLSKSTQWKDVIKVAVLAGVHVLILVAEKDLGAALIYYITFLSILYVASRNIGYLGLGLFGGSAAAVVAYHLFTHVQTRVTAWRDPWGTINDAGYQVAQSLFAIGTGGWFGMGLYQGMPEKIPVVEQDFIFSAIAEEMGGIFAICLLMVCISCFLMFFNVAMQMKEQFYKLIALGLGTVYGFQVFLTVGGVTKFIPSTGVTLPLVSYGGSSLFSTMIMFAVVQGLYIRRQDEGAANERKNAAPPRRRKTGFDEDVETFS